MENFYAYITEIRTLNMKSIDKFMNPAGCAEYNREYPEKLERLQNLALKDLNWLSKESVKQKLAFINRLEKQFTMFDAAYPELLTSSRNGLLYEKELFRRLVSLFDIIRFERKYIPDYFMICLYVIILSKHHSMAQLKNKTEDLLLEKILNEKKYVQIQNTSEAKDNFKN